MRSRDISSRVATTVLILSSLASTSVAISCYSHNGVEASSSEYYNATQDGALVGCGAGTTTCCLESQYCDVDLLCHDRSSGQISRQYCSDPSWPSDKCSALCRGYDAAGVVLTQCDDAGTKFCCGPNNSTCCEAGNYAQINSVGLIVAIGTSTIPTSTKTSTATTTSKNPATTTATTTSGAAVQTTSTSPSPSSKSGTSSATRLGAGLGVGLGVPFLIAISAAIFLCRRSRNKKNAAMAGTPGGAEDTQKYSPEDMYRYSGHPDKKTAPEQQHMLMSTEREELPGTSAAHELP